MFCADVSALTASKLTVVKRKTSQRIYECLRRRVAGLAVDEARPFTGEVAVDEACFGARRVRGKRGRGASGKTPVIGLLKRGGKVLTSVVKNCSKAESWRRSSGDRSFPRPPFTPTAGRPATALSWVVTSTIVFITTTTSLPAARTTEAAEGNSGGWQAGGPSAGSKAFGATPSSASSNCAAYARSSFFSTLKNRNGAGTIVLITYTSSYSKTFASTHSNLGKTLHIFL